MLKYAVQPTSRIAYQNDVKPTLGERQSRVLEEMRTFDNVTNSELAQALGWPINTVTPRVHELRKMGFVKEWGKRPCRITGRLAIAWVEAKDTLI